MIKKNIVNLDINLEKRLLQRCLSGEKQAWDEFVKQYSRLVYDSIIRTFNRFSSFRENDVIGDLHNDVFLALLKDQYQALRRFEGRNGCRLASYIRTISVNITINYLKRKKPTISIHEEYDTEDGKRARFIKELAIFDPYDLLEAKETIEAVNRLFSRLKEDEKEFCKLYFIDGVEANEMAKHSGITVDYFYVRKQRMIDKLRKIAKEEKIC